MVNTAFTFQPNTKIQFVFPEDIAVASDEFSDIKSDATIDNGSDQPDNPEETSESDYLSDMSQQSDKSLQNTFLKEPKYLVFWPSLLMQFHYFLLTRRKQKLRL